MAYTDLMGTVVSIDDEVVIPYHYSLKIVRVEGFRCSPEGHVRVHVYADSLSKNERWWPLSSVLVVRKVTVTKENVVPQVKKEEPMAEIYINHLLNKSS